MIIYLFSPSPSFSFDAKIGVVPIEGAILQSQEITSQLEKFAKNENIKAILLRIDSPGGAIGPTQEIHREVTKSALRKPVVASLGAVAASGGYYIASAAHKVVANPGTITGSIGALMQFFRVEELLEKIGIHMEVLKTGEFKDVGSPHRELTQKDREILNSVLGQIREQFVGAVASGRKLPVETVEKVADGRIFSGARARELGLVDELGNFHDAVEIAKKEAGILGDVNLVYPRKSLGFLESLFKAAFRSLASELLEMQTRLEYRWEAHAVPLVTEKK